MLSLRKPTDAAVVRYLIESQHKSFTYEQPGMTRDGTYPGSFDIDQERTLLGTGVAVFEQAKEALCRWQMFPRSLAKLYWPDRRIEPGITVAVRFRVGPLWSLNPCRIVYSIDEPVRGNGLVRFGFAYGTLADHLECGEEQFLVTWNPRDDRVYYELLAISQPHHLLTRLGYRVVRREQAKFRRLSGLSMQQAVRCPREVAC